MQGFSKEMSFESVTVADSWPINAYPINFPESFGSGQIKQKKKKKKEVRVIPLSFNTSIQAKYTYAVSWKYS